MSLITILVVVLLFLLLAGTFARFCKRLLRTEIGEVLMELALGLVRIPTKSAGDSKRRRPPIPIEAGRGFR